MKLLYERYPQLIDSKTNACIRNYASQLLNLTYYPYDVMTMYGSMMINDIGSYEQCKQMGMSDYSFIYANITRVPLTIFFGACLPAECT